MEYLSMVRLGCFEKFISDRKNKYSSKLFKTSYLGENMVFLCSAEANKFLFSNENNLVKTWLPSNFEKLFPNSDKTNMLQETMRMRKLAEMFSEPKSLQQYVGIIDALAKEHLKMYWDQREQVLVHPLAKKYIFALACRLLFNIQDPETVQELETLFGRVVSGLISLPINIPGTRFSNAMRASKELRVKFAALIKQMRMNDVNVLESPSMLTQLITEKYEDGEDINESDLANKISGLILAAYETSSSTMVAIIKCLAELPPVYERLHWTAHATHKSPEYFRNPEEFDPSRFEEKNTVPFSYVPFGGGRHTCPGKEYARLQLLVFMHNWVKKFRWEKVFPDEQLIMDPLLVPAKGLPVRLYHH